MFGTAYQIGFSAGGAAVAPNAETTRYLTTSVLPAATNAGDQIIFVGASDLASMSFELVGTTWTYRAQTNTPLLSALKTGAQRDAIGARLPAGQEYWYCLIEDVGADAAGFYRITPDGIGGGVQLGPFVTGGGGGGGGGTFTAQVFPAPTIIDGDLTPDLLDSGTLQDTTTAVRRMAVALRASGLFTD